MTSSRQYLKHGPLAALALAFACSASAQMGTPGSSDPATTTPGSVTSQTGSGLGTGGSTDISTDGASKGNGYTNGASNGGTMDTRSGLAADGSTRRSTGGWMGRSMYSQGEGNYSLIPYSTGGYVGVNVGQPDFDTPCFGAFSCSDNTTSYKLYTGGMFNQYVGGELAYVNMGRAKRADGRTEAYGINLSLVGRMPLGGFNLFGKVGTTYGRTKTTAALATIPTGKESGWGGSYGVGVGFDLTRASSIVLEWERHDFRFSGLGRQSVDSTTLGYVHRF